MFFFFMDVQTDTITILEVIDSLVGFQHFFKALPRYPNTVFFSGFLREYWTRHFIINCHTLEE